jgi:autotransporter-associated beta strand protein
MHLCRLVAAAVVALVLSRAANAQTWVGGTANWIDVTNWNPNTVPVSGNTATFNAASGNTSISLGGAAQPIGSILFDTANAAAYTLGTTAGDTFNVDAGGSITVNTTVTTLQTIGAAVSGAGALTFANNGTATGGLTVGGNVSAIGALTFNNNVANTTITINGAITSASSVVYNATAGGASNNNNIIINGINTYTAPTTMTINTGSAGSLQIGSDQAFGNGKLVINVQTGSNAPVIKALGGARTISNTVDLNTGLTLSGTNSLTFTGPTTLISALTAQRTYNSSVSGLVMTFGSAASPSTFTLGNPTSNGGDNVGKTALLTAVSGAMNVVNDVMQDVTAGGGTASGSVTVQGAGTLRLTGANTFTGLVTLNSGASIVQLGSSSTGSSGPLGLGTVTTGNATAETLQPIFADQSISNPITLTTGNVIVSAAPVTGINADATGPHNLTLTGAISGAQGITKTGANTVTLTNAGNSYAGTTAVSNGTLKVNGTNSGNGQYNATATGTLQVNGSLTGTGAVNATGTGTAGAGGTVGGTGSISGIVTISSATAGSQGGIVYPGPGGTAPGTLNVASMTWNPKGQYVFVYDANNQTTGSNVNGFINGSANLNLNLGGGAFDINLKPLSFFPGNNPSSQTYTIANFATGTGLAGPTDITSMFSFSNASQATYPGSPAPTMMLIGASGTGPQSIQITFTPVPEPTSVLAVCGLAGGLGWWRARRKKNATIA